MSEIEEIRRELRRINRKVTLTLWVVGVPVVLLMLFYLALVLIGPSVEMSTG